jgi:hypothetical protein
MISKHFIWFTKSRRFAHSFPSAVWCGSCGGVRADSLQFLELVRFLVLVHFVRSSWIQFFDRIVVVVVAVSCPRFASCLGWCCRGVVAVVVV